MSLLYLGNRVGESGPEAQVRYKSKYLTTHGLVFGMTGSGKTGLCVGLLEEASRNNIPVIAIDPKGDLTNLALSWPEIAPGQFADWVDPSKLDSGETASDLGAKMSGVWRKGLAGDGLGPDDIRQMRESTKFTVYTPGSASGVPVSMLEKFEPPPNFADMVDEDRSDLVAGVASAVLALVDVEADPLQSREHILISNLLTHAWDKGETLDIQSLIGRIHTPPFTKLGVFDMDAFFPQKKRTELAMRLNGLIASPSFSAWLTGEPLNIDKMLEKSPKGSRTSIFYIAHLDDSERMSFVSLLLDRLVAWMRAQPGSGELRALLYFDEVFGYLPPYPKNPPSKRPLLTIMKQARAFGLGAVLATQNPVDVDYKAITNAGTWMIGKLQTDQDKERVLDGLMGSSGDGTGPSRKEVSDVISGLEPRQFVMSSAHQDSLTTFKTRFAMSYLRGPMTRQEIARLTKAGFYNLDGLGGAAAPPQPKPRQAPSQPPQPRESPAPDGIVEADFGDDAADATGDTGPRSSPPASTWTTPTSTTPTPRSPSTTGTIGTPAPRSQRQSLPAVHPKGVPAAFLSRGALSIPDIRDSLSINLQDVTLGKTTYVAALMGSARFSFRAHVGGTRLSAGDCTHVMRPIAAGADAIHWGSAPETDIEAHHLLSKAEKGADFAAPPAWMFDKGAFASAQKDYIAQLAAIKSLRIPASESLGIYGSPDESLEAFKVRVAREMGRRTEFQVSKIANDAGQEDNLLAAKIAEVRELLEMDKREMAYHKARGDDEKLSRVVASARLRMQNLRDLVFRRDRIAQDNRRASADVEFAAMDRLATVKLLTVELAVEDITVDFFGLLWVPT